ncbi:MerR family transcriptional regulator [Oxalobacteraceae bacterium]|nr:MerR family transcriptional regulator [Oxalobacteraceae bacterium]
MNESASISTSSAVAGAYRSGVAARLAGLPVETLRVWERRYGVSDTERSAHGQRLYSAEQVRRLALIKQLVDQGQQIGSLARLPLEQLRQQLALPVSRAPERSVRVALVGQALARRMAASAAGALALEVVASCLSLDGAAQALASVGSEVVLVELSELSDGAVPAIAALRERTGAATVVLYRFCASATIRQLRALGCLVARAPADLGEIELLCRTALAAPAAPPMLTVSPSMAAMRPPAARRLDDQALAALAAAGNSVACECPRHLADILLMLTSFERYSAQCAASSPADAELHRELNHCAGQARTLLEAALVKLARADGLPLPAGL